MFEFVGWGIKARFTMKNIALSILGAACVAGVAFATPAAAQYHGGYHGGYHHYDDNHFNERGAGKGDPRCGAHSFRVKHENYCYGAGGIAYSKTGAGDPICGNPSYRDQHRQYCNGAGGVWENTDYRHRHHGH
jgi:hypothetical protein